jgi:hypothetical protein
MMRMKSALLIELNPEEAVERSAASVGSMAGI